MNVHWLCPQTSVQKPQACFFLRDPNNVKRSIVPPHLLTGNTRTKLGERIHEKDQNSDHKMIKIIKPCLWDCVPYAIIKFWPQLPQIGSNITWGWTGVGVICLDPKSDLKKAITIPTRLQKILQGNILQDTSQLKLQTDTGLSGSLKSIVSRRVQALAENILDTEDRRVGCKQAEQWSWIMEEVGLFDLFSTLICLRPWETWRVVSYHWSLWRCAGKKTGRNRKRDNNQWR